MYTCAQFARMPQFINYNGEFLHEDATIVGAGNRGLRYGDGLFETIKVIDSELLLEEFHFDRLFAGLALLRFDLPPYFTYGYVREQIFALLQKNTFTTARLRLNVFRKNGGLYDTIDSTPDFVIECSMLHEKYLEINSNGLILDVYEEAIKTCDRFSGIKSNNFLPYAMAALYANERKLDDCLVLNSCGRVCDATIANVFWIEDKHIYTPPLSEGCIAGVMRRHLLDILPQRGYSIKERVLQIADLDTADELFLTNAIAGIRWVAEFRGRRYQSRMSSDIYRLIA